MTKLQAHQSDPHRNLLRPSLEICGMALASKASAYCLMDETVAILREEEIAIDTDGFSAWLVGAEICLKRLVADGTGGEDIGWRVTKQ